MSENESPVLITGKPDAYSHICKFTVNRPLLPGGSLSCRERTLAKDSPLLEELFLVEGVQEVFVQGNSVTISKGTEESWKTFGKKIGDAIRVSLKKSETHRIPLVSEQLEEKNPVTGQSPKNLYSDEAIQIQKLLDDQINPAVAAHGGHVALVDFRDQVAYVKMSGGCQGCGMATQTIKDGVETAIKKEMDFVKSVIDVTDHANGENPYFQPN